MLTIATIVSLKGLRRCIDAGARTYMCACKNLSHIDRWTNETMNRKMPQCTCIVHSIERKKKEKSRKPSRQEKEKRDSCVRSALAFARGNGPLNDRHNTHGQRSQHDLIYIDNTKIRFRIECFLHTAIYNIKYRTIVMFAIVSCLAVCGVCERNPN